MCLVLGKTRTFSQKNGPDIQLKVYGDEFYVRYETPEGYTAVYDTDLEQYCFASLARGHLISTGTPLHKPAPWGLAKHVQEDKTIRNAKFDARYQAMRPQAVPPPGVSATFGGNQGLLPGTQLSRQPRVKGLTLLVNFKDLKTQITPEQVDALLNGDNFTAHGNACSVKSYFKTISSGRIEYVNEVKGPVTLSKNRAHYIGNKCMAEALDIAVETLGINLADYDSMDRGVVDAVNFLYAGQTLYSGWLWPHNHTMYYSRQGIRTDLYTIQSLGRQPVDMKIGTICHEAGHLICRFPDLYDYGKRDGDSDPSAGMGNYCLMSSGSHLNHGRSPAPVCGYLRHLAGWAKNEILVDVPGQYQAKYGDYDTLFKYPVPNRPNEYFILENRTRMGLDTHCPSSGLAVYHCDTQGSNEWQGGTADQHYQCALIQADGARHLENNRNKGDGSDLFADKPGLVLSRETIPSSKAWGGMSSGLKLYNVSAPGETILFETGRPSGPGKMKALIVKSARPSALIPDSDPKGITDTLTVAESGTIETITLDVDITHTYVGDLKVVLTAPGQEKIILADRVNTPGNDLVASYDSLGLLAPLVNTFCQGHWQLSVMDLVARDIGRLNAWKLQIQCKTEKQTLFKENTDRVAIPDNDPKGVSSQIQVSETGRIKSATLAFEVDHSYHGDLRIGLIPPGQPLVEMVAFNSLGSANGLLKRKTSTDSGPLLAALVNLPVQGDWVLQLSDQWAKDSGALIRWSLAFELE